MTAAFAKALDVLRAIYRQEVERLADELKPRILMDEFIGENEKGDPAHLHLEDELVKRHPLLRAATTALGVIACSECVGDPGNGIEIGSGGGADVATVKNIRDSAAECLAYDVLRLAAKRGWIRRVKDGGFYVWKSIRPRAA